MIKIDSELERIKSLYSFRILDTPSEKEYDDITELAALICDTPISLVTLLDERRQFIKSCKGVENQEVPRVHSMCNHTIDNPNELTVIADTRKDPRTKNNPYAGPDNRIYFYAGCPILDENGYALGSLCVIDTKPRELTEEQKLSLERLGNQVSRLLQLRKQGFKLEESNNEISTRATRFHSIIAATKLGTWEWNLRSNQVIINERWAEILGFSLENLGKLDYDKWFSMIHPSDKVYCYTHIKHCLEAKVDFFDCQYRMKHKTGEWVWIRSQGQVISRDDKQKPLLFYGSHIDITEDKIFEAQLSTLADNVPAVILRYRLKDDYQEFLYVSQAVEEVWGVPSQLVLEDVTNVWKYMDDEDVPRVQQSIQKSANELIEWNSEWRYDHPELGLRWHRGKGKPTPQEDGSVIWDSIVLDITEEKILANKLKDLNKKLTTAQEISKLGYWEFNIKEETFGLSKQLLEILELTDNQPFARKKDLLKIVHPDDRKKLWRNLKDAFSGKKELDFEHRILCDSGVKWVRQRGLINKNEAGNKVYFETSLQDITATKLMSLSLEESIKQFKYVTKATSDTIWDWNVTENKLHWGENYEKNFGHKIDPDSTRNFADWEDNIHPEDKNSVLSSFYSLMDNNEPIWIKEYRFRRRNGEYAHIMDKGFVIRDGSNKPVRVVGAMQDLTQVKQNESLLLKLNKELEQKAHELSISNKELEQFAYVASHDLQEPLRMISSFLSRLENKYESVIDEKGKKYIHFAIDGAERMKTIILDLLDYSRVNNSHEKFEKVDLNIILNEVKILNKKAINEKKAVIQIDDLPVVLSYRAALLRIFHNLINNSLKYQPEGNKPEVKIGYEANEYYHEFSVSDNGIGISPEYYEKVFIIFQRLHTREEFQGTGMGLAITKKFVEAIGGQIWIEPNNGKGTTFKLRLKKEN
ncbi:PAS domain-containing protein [Christiangramia salexigens]|uniref:histidine kinase n=1 Tax=Christiangramia salexigens TaxID=1913577 RepID=A0A1L3J1Q0_9FLAO|nr:PAS domain-containing protein [Christiangramia salexigens]APG59041.1 hypothetical protein LPB144_00860 [Christiangramia salexigens]